MDELENLRYELGCVVDTMIGIKHSCIRHNDRDGEVYAQGKIDAYTCVIACLTDILEDDEVNLIIPIEPLSPTVASTTCHRGAGARATSIAPARQ